MGIGNLKLKVTNIKRESFVTLSKCLYVPDLSCHLVAIGTVVSSGGRTVEFSEHSAVVKGPGGQVLLHGHLNNGVYVANAVVQHPNLVHVSRGTGVYGRGSVNHAPSSGDFDSLLISTDTRVPGANKGNVWLPQYGSSSGQCQPTVCGVNNTNLGSSPSPSVSKVSAAYLGECGQGTVNGERSFSSDKNVGTTFQDSPSPVMDSRRDKVHTCLYGQSGGTIPVLNRSRPPCMVPKDIYKCSQSFSTKTTTKEVNICSIAVIKWCST